jgi:hypothetical protein
MTAKAQGTFRIPWLSPLEILETRSCRPSPRSRAAHHHVPGPCPNDAIMSWMQNYPMSDSPCVLDSTPN